MRSGSTTRTWYKAKLQERPHGEHRARRAPFRLVQSPLTRSRQVTLRLIPSGEPWVEIKYQGQTTRRPGTMELWELLRMLSGDE